MHHQPDSGRGDAATSRPYQSTVQHRTATIASIQLPILLSAMCAYGLSSQLFGLGTLASLCSAATTGYAIYLVEKIVLAAPRSLGVMAARLVLTGLISALGACAFDLVIFEKDIGEELRRQAVAELAQRRQPAIDAKAAEVERMRLQWEEAQRKTNCEADGSCGSRRQQLGPIWRELKQQAEQKRQDHLTAERQLDELKAKVAGEIEALRQSPKVVRDAGVLNRLQALHAYISAHPAAQLGWWGLFLTVAILDASVLGTKLAFGRTAEDELEQLREQIALQQARRYARALERTQATRDQRRPPRQQHRPPQRHQQRGPASSDQHRKPTASRLQ
jgi:Domain of unknown function (DUF4407)